MFFAKRTFGFVDMLKSKLIFCKRFSNGWKWIKIWENIFLIVFELNFDIMLIISFLENKWDNNKYNFLKEELPVIKHIWIDSIKFLIILFNNAFWSFTEFNIYK